MYTENSSTVQTAIIIANPLADPVTVTVEATTLSGASVNLTGLLTIPGNGQILTLEGQIPGFDKIDASFEGVLRISTGTAKSVAAGIFRVRVNERMNAGISLFLHFRLWTKLRRRCGPSLHFHSMSLAAVSRLRSCYSAAGRIHHPGE
ncbi:MAG: hypothetical protein DMG19_04395 [Acidobacteria bacterium]|nr:MAG: hypothetical protein DMG19_04395 [Acidobacteriota bacterium]